MTKHQHIILCGSIAIDRIMNFQGQYKNLIQSEKIHVLSLSVLIDQLTDTYGGTAANIAYSLALCGEKPILLGSVGQDAQAYIAKLNKLGIITTFIQKSSLPTASFTVLTDQDNNQIGGFYPGAMSDHRMTTLNAWYDTNPLVVVSAHDPNNMRQQVRACKEHKLTLVYDIGQQVSNVEIKDLVEGIATAHILILNDYELSVLSKRTGKSEADIKSSIPIVVTTLGSHGSRIEGSSVKNSVSIGIIPNVIAIDPTGAGDAYRAGFLYGYIHDWDLKTCGQLGATCAAYAVETQGTQNYTFTKQRLAKRYEKAFNESLPITHI